MTTERGIFSVEHRGMPGIDNDAQWQSPRERTTLLLDAIEAFSANEDLKPGSVEMLKELKVAAHFLRGELEVPERRDPWRIADFALRLSQLLRDLQANEALYKPVMGKRRSEKTCRDNGAAKNQEKKDAADTDALEKFKLWQSKAATQLKGLSPEQQLKKYFRAKRPSEDSPEEWKKAWPRHKRRINSLYKAGHLPLPPGK